MQVHRSCQQVPQACGTGRAARTPTAVAHRLHWQWRVHTYRRHVAGSPAGRTAAAWWLRTWKVLSRQGGTSVTGMPRATRRQPGSCTGRRRTRSEELLCSTATGQACTAPGAALCARCHLCGVAPTSSPQPAPAGCKPASRGSHAARERSCHFRGYHPANDWSTRAHSTSRLPSAAGWPSNAVGWG